MEFNTSYLNRTENKDARSTPLTRPVGVVFHETGGGGALEWNLYRSNAVASYNYLITRNGTIYHYVDEIRYIAYGAGIKSPGPPVVETRVTIDGKTYVGYQVNANLINVEVEGENDGSPITSAQRDSIVALMRYFKITYGIPLDDKHHLQHKDLAPGYKTDPRGYSVPVALAFANVTSAPNPPVPVSAPVTLDELRVLAQKARAWDDARAAHEKTRRVLDDAGSELIAYLLGVAQRNNV